MDSRLPLPSPPSRGRPSRQDVAPAAALAVLSQVEVWVSSPPRGAAAAAAMAFVAAAALVWRRQAPLAVAVVAALALAMMDPLGAGSIDVLAMLLTLLVAGFALGAHASRREAATGAIVMVALLWTAVAQSADDSVRSFLFTGLSVILPIAAGLTARRRQRAAAELVVANARLAAERTTAEQSAIARERRRITAELHDIVGHNVSLIGLQAGAGRRLVDDSPDRSKSALGAIEELSRQTIGELRRLLEVTEPGDDAGLAPQPSLADLRTLVDGVRDHAGLEVDLDVDEGATAAPAGVQLAAYRLIQEALTNTVRHAGAHRVAVGVDVGPAALCVTVVDDGAAAGVNGAGTAGRGLAGMRERVRLYGGVVTAGPARDGGWAVRATLPLPADS
jgi:signal transduction histidine kinase